MNQDLSDEQKQILYRDARFTEQYDKIWQTVGKCVFCDLNERYVFYEENGVVMTITLYAYIDGHLMIIPRRHVRSAKELTPEEWETIRKFTYIAKKLIKDVHGIKGMQLVQKDGAEAQSTVEHLHFHCVPFDSPDLYKWNFRKLKNTPLQNVALYRDAHKKIKKLAEKFDQKYQAGQTIGVHPYNVDWADMAFGSKKTINSLNATFIAAPRELSRKRLTQLVKIFLPKGNLVLGLAKEEYVAGFERQPQFRMLRETAVKKLVDKINTLSPKHKIYLLHYFQRELPFLLEKLDFQKTIFINGSWKHTFHTQPAYYTLVNRRIPYQLVSPFVDETEARDFEATVIKNSQPPTPPTVATAEEMLRFAAEVAQQSYDYSFQTGVVIGKKTNHGKYRYTLSTFNKVVPFQTYAMHYGGSREKNFSPPNDLNHYDAIHAEVEAIITAQKQGVDLKGTTLFINLLPCPSCSRMFCETDISEFVYSLDHSNGYAIQLLEKAGKTIRRITKGE